MKIGVVSDTHGSIQNTLQAVTKLADYDLSAVLHCGDIVSAGIVPLFVEWPTHYVFGNCDTHTQDLRLAIQEAGHFCHGRFGELDLGGKKIAMLHGDDYSRFEETVNSGKYDLVCYGHTHRYEFHQVGPTLVLNPGALFRADPYTFAVVDLDSMQVTHVPLS
ncbi:YfcE family phosphodiesterase [Planctomicrobium sp. SH668]|uniref:YfcE family phosphodiesterase n=1 Tax=Planctomicrobium sp. SH668 TaxID=3448126 RepID=UPI003F5B0177